MSEGMDFACSHFKGMFRIPDKTREPGFLPWDVKEGHTISEPVPIRNANVEQASTGSSGDSRYFVELTDSHSTTEEAIDATGSSRGYAIMAQKAKVWFHAKKYDRVLLGRFANQLHVYNSCWKLANTYMYSRSDEDGAKMQVI